VGRTVADEHYKMCLSAGLIMSGINAEVMKGQWEYQVGPCCGLAAGDQLWISRYILYRVCEKHNVHVSFDPKPIRGDWNGSGCHTNYSTESMRDGVKGSIERTLVGLRHTHNQVIPLYGKDNNQRMTGEHETSNLTDFSYGVANRKCSIRIPRTTAADKRGYIEDRRPASNMDPYLVTATIADVTLLQEFDEPDFTLDENTYFFTNESLSSNGRCD
jgi:glutamine synthetase